MKALFWKGFSTSRSIVLYYLDRTQFKSKQDGNFMHGHPNATTTKFNFAKLFYGVWTGA